MRKKKIKKSLIITTTAMITIISIVEINRKHEYKLLAQSADALEIQIKDDGLWTSKEEINTASTLVNNAINDLYVEAIEAGIDIETIIQGATTQADAIYLVQGALKATEQQVVEETEKTQEAPTKEEVPVEETPVEPDATTENPESETDSATSEPAQEEQVVEETPAEEEALVEETPTEEQPANDNNTEQTPPAEVPPVVEVEKPAINNFVVKQTEVNDSDSAKVDISFEIDNNDNEISKVFLVIENETGASKEQVLELTSDNNYAMTVDLLYGNYNFKIIVEYVNAATNTTDKVESELINLDIISDYILNMEIAQGENPGEVVLDLTQSILPDSYILYDVYVDGEVYEKNIRASENIITLKDVSAGTHQYQVVAKYLNDKQIQEIESEVMEFSVTATPVISNFAINQNIDANNETTIDISFDLEDNENTITNIYATATNVETQEIYELSEITLIESEEEIVSYQNVAQTTLEHGTYNFELVVEYSDSNNNINEVTTTVDNYEVINESQPKTDDLRQKIQEKIEAL